MPRGWLPPRLPEPGWENPLGKFHIDLNDTAAISGDTDTAYQLVATAHRASKQVPQNHERTDMIRQAITSDRAPAALGAYSQAIVAGGLIFCSGTAGINPDTGAVPDGIEAQTEQALLNLEAVLEAAGASFDDLVKTIIFYTDASDFQLLDAVYARRMPNPPPARSAPANVRLPRGLLVSIDAIAVAPTSGV